MVFKTINPFTEKIIAEYSMHSERYVSNIIDELQKSFYLWKSESLQVRIESLQVIKNTLIQERSFIAKLITDEMGKPISQSCAEVDKSILLCDYYYDNSAKILSEINVETKNSKSYYQYSALGIILGIMPWNFPLWQVMRFAIPNIVLGNVILLKHAPNTIGVSLAIENILAKIYPTKIFRNIIVDVDLIPKILQHKFVSAVSITGSRKAGSSVAKYAGINIKKSVLELGGNDPFIVFDDADLENAVSQSIESRLLNSGQVCIAAKRIIVVKSIYKKFEEMLLDSLRNVIVGSPYETMTRVGPLARKDIKHNVVAQIGKAIDNNAVVVYRSKIQEHKGLFFPVIVLKNVLPGNIAFEEEIFGPVFCLTEAKDNEEAIKLANSTDYGLSAALFSQNIVNAEKICRYQLNFGMCSINKMVVSDPRLPFGGVKSSGYGRENAEFGLKEFANIKTIIVK